MKKKFFGNKADENDYIFIERATLTDRDNNIIEVTEKEVEEGSIVPNKEYFKRTINLNKYGDIKSVSDTSWGTILDSNLDSEIDNPDGGKTITKFLTKSYNIYPTTNTDKLSGDFSEFYSPEDKFSARNLNRPIFQNFEDVENIYEVLQNVCKTLYGQKENGIIPDIFEEMNPDKVVCGNYLNRDKKFVRIPTGAFFAKLSDKQAEYYKYTKTEDNQYSRDFFIDNDHNSIVIFNRPNVELFERQLAEYFNINLNDQDNNVKLNYYFINDATPKINDTIPRAESTFIKNNNDRYNVKRGIRYYIDVSKTNYNYEKNSNGNTVIATVPEVGRIPASQSADPTDSFELVRAFSNIYKSYLSKIGDFFSLEEVIEFPCRQNWQTGKYVIFFDPATKEPKPKDNEYISYSYSKRFGMCSKAYFNNKNNGLDEYKVIKLFELDATVNNDNGITWIDSDEGLPLMVSATACLNKIDRTTFDIKNVNVKNLLNDLVVENKKSNVNISEAHIIPKDSEKDNISIGFYNLGYSDEAKYSQKKDNIRENQVFFGDTTEDEGQVQDTRNRELASEGDKYILGENNIAIGTYSIKNTIDNDGVPKNNIAIGKKTLENVLNGNNNIEIGLGSGVVKKPNYLISIGSNFEINSNAENHNIVIGHSNSNNLTLKEKNIIFGFDNKFTPNNENPRSIINSKNTIIGIENNIGLLNTNNLILGNYNSYDKNYTVEVEEVYGNTKDFNYILGNDNLLAYINKSNIILGSNNQKNSKLEEYENFNYNISIGNSNSFKEKNSILGNDNIILDEETIVVGNDNNLKDGNTNLLIGRGNTTNNSENNYLFGEENEETNSNTNLLIGRGNTTNNSENNYLFGENNIISNSNRNIVIGKSNIISSNNINNAIFISNNLNENQCIRDDFSKNNKINSNEPLAPGEREEGNNSPKIIIGNSYDDPVAKTKYFIKLDVNNDAFIRARTTTFTKDVYVDNSITTPIININSYIHQNPNTGFDKDIATEKQNTLVPNAGNIPSITNFNNLNDLLNFKSFIGTIGSDGNKYIISNRDKNGYGKDEVFVIAFDGEKEKRLKIKYFDEENTNYDEELIDSRGGQTIKGWLTLENQLRDANPTEDAKQRIILKPDTTSEFTNSIKALSFIATSARSEKTDIKPTKYNAIDEINKIDVVDFYFKSDKEKENPKVGFIADDTDPIFSTKDKNSMDLYNTVGMLLKAVQELSAENKELKERIEKLEK